MTAPASRAASDGSPELLIAFAALVAGSFAMGVSPVFVRLADVGPLTSAFWRVALALPALWLWMRLDTGFPGGGIRFAGRPRRLAIVLLTGALFAGDLFFWHLSIMNTTVANATFFATMAPLFTVLTAALLLKEELRRALLSGLGLCLLGGALIIGSSIDLDPSRLLGDGLGIVTALFFGTYMVAVQQARRLLPASALMFWSTVVTAALLFIAATALEDSLWPASLLGLASLLSLALLSHCAGQGLLAYALGTLPATFSSLVVFLEAVAAAIVGWLVLGEAVGPLQAVGALAILAGIYVARPRVALPGR